MIKPYRTPDIAFFNNIIVIREIVRRINWHTKMTTQGQIGELSAELFREKKSNLYRNLIMFPEFLELNKTFLGSLAAQEKEVLADLIQLNEYGFLALKRQSGECKIIEAQSTYQLVEKKATS